MIWRKLGVAAMALGSVAAPTSALAAEKPIATVERPTEIRSWKGIGAFSVYDDKAGVYRLAITRAGAKPQLVPVAPRPVAFDADVGPDAKGEAAIVYSRCESEAPNRRDCDIFRYSIGRNVESKVTNADSDTASEFSPTLWRGRVAWVRTYDGRAASRPYVYTRTLTAPRARRSQRLPGLPTRRCSDITDRCSRPAGAVESLELYGRLVALNVSYTYEGSPGFAQKEIRLATLGGDVRGIAAQTTGLSGQSYVGPSFDEGALYWARYCAGDESACNKNNSGAFRYRLSTREYALAGHTRKLTGFSYVDDDRVYEVRGERECGARVGTPPTAGFPDCQVVLTDPLKFTSTRAPR
ncbi:MAG TPA: hypothetical protein VGV40_02150 [Solirubrobacteraceae bacterium]|nr:hypothetical protein [Solirubrobacteraceae bacterium]